MCLQGRDLIDVTVSDHLKLLFDTFKELIVTIIISVRGLGVGRQVSLPVRLSCLGGCQSYGCAELLLGGRVPLFSRHYSSNSPTNNCVEGVGQTTAQLQINGC